MYIVLLCYVRYLYTVGVKGQVESVRMSCGVSNTQAFSKNLSCSPRTLSDKGQLWSLYTWLNIEVSDMAYVMHCVYALIMHAQLNQSLRQREWSHDLLHTRLQVWRRVVPGPLSQTRVTLSKRAMHKHDGCQWLKVHQSLLSINWCRVVGAHVYLESGTHDSQQMWDVNLYRWNE